MNTYARIASLAVLAASACVTAGCGGSPPQMTVTGTVTVPDNPAEGLEPPVQEGSQVTVTDPSGKVIAVTELNDNAAQGAVFTLAYGFTVRVPEGLSYYGISISGLTGVTQFTQLQMKQGPAVCSGEAC